MVRPYLKQEQREAIALGTTFGHFLVAHLELMKLFRAISQNLIVLNVMRR